jgi:hypothetical protein
MLIPFYRRAGRLISLRHLLSVHVQVRGRPNLRLQDRHPKIIGTDLHAEQWDEGDVPTEEALLDGAELRLVGLDVDIDVMELADAFAVAIDEHLAQPVGSGPGCEGVWGRHVAITSNRSLGAVRQPTSSLTWRSTLDVGVELVVSVTVRRRRGVRTTIVKTRPMARRKMLKPMPMTFLSLGRVSLRTGEPACVWMRLSQ